MRSKEVNALIASLRAFAPPLLPVRVYLRNLTKEDHIGSTELIYSKDDKPSHFKIVVHNQVSYTYVRLVLLHEWAHALAWSLSRDVVDDHGPEWALAFSKLYQHFIEP